jgi:hypothetical protein
MLCVIPPSIGKIMTDDEIREQIATCDNADPHEAGDNFALVCECRDTMQSMLDELIAGRAVIEAARFIPCTPGAAIARDEAERLQTAFDAYQKVRQ